MAMEETIDGVFRRLSAGELGEDESPLFQEGWETQLPSGKVVARSTLQHAAGPLIALGAEAVPYLLPRVANENAALRYVAIYALERITGEKPYLPYFDPFGGGEDRTHAIEIWKRWYETNKQTGRSDGPGEP
jgi:hypothetical protein